MPGFETSRDRSLRREALLLWRRARPCGSGGWHTCHDDDDYDLDDLDDLEDSAVDDVDDNFDCAGEHRGGNLAGFEWP